MPGFAVSASSHQRRGNSLAVNPEIIAMRSLPNMSLDGIALSGGEDSLPLLRLR